MKNINPYVFCEIIMYSSRHEYNRLTFLVMAFSLELFSYKPKIHSTIKCWLFKRSERLFIELESS